MADDKKPWEEAWKAAPEAEAKPWEKTYKPAGERGPDSISSDPMVLPPAPPGQLRSVAQRTKSAYDEFMAGTQGDIDYKAGAPWLIRTALSKQDNPQEADLLLKKYYGEGDYGQDEGGRWWVREGGKKVSVYPRGGLGASMENLAAGTMGSGNVLAGGVLGGAVGALGGPYAGFTVPAGVGIGSAAGKAVDEGVKYLAGTFAKEPQEEVSELLNTGALNMGLAGSGPIMKDAVRGFKKAAFGVTTQSAAVGEKWLERGAIPPVGSVAPEATGFKRKQSLRNAISGDPNQAKNVQAVENEIRYHLQTSGMSADEVNAAMAEIKNKAAAIGTEEPSQSIVQAAQRRTNMFEADIGSNMLEARKILDRQEKAFRKWSDEPVGRLSQELGEMVIADRQQFSQRMQAAYNDVHDLGGGVKAVPAKPAIEEAWAIVEQFQATPGAVPPVIMGLAKRSVEIEEAKAQVAALQAQGKAVPDALRIKAERDIDFMDIKEAHDTRTTLRRAAKMWNLPNLMPDRSYALISQVEDALDGAITNVANSGKGLPAEAAKQLKIVDGLYREGSGKYKDYVFNKIVKDIRSGLVPDAEVVTSLITKPGNLERTKELISLMPPQLKENVARVDMQNKIARASYRNFEGKLVTDGRKVHENLQESAKVDDLLYDKTYLGQFRRWAEGLMVADGEMDASVLRPSTNIKGALQRWQTHKEALEQFVNENPIGALRSGDSNAIDTALGSLIQPGRTARLEQTMAALNANERNSVHQYFLKRLFSRAMDETESRTPIINGDKLHAFLKQYTQKQQDLLLPYGMANDLQELGRDIKYLFPSVTGDEAFAGGQIAAGVTSKSYINPNALRKRIGFAISGWLTDRPAVLHWMADIHKKDPETAKMIMPGFGRWILNSASSGPGSKQLNPEAESQGDWSGIGLRKFAEGGQPPVGEPVVVGEQGPEVVVFNQPGTVIPNEADQIRKAGEAAARRARGQTTRTPNPDVLRSAPTGLVEELMKHASRLGQASAIEMGQGPGTGGGMEDIPSPEQMSEMFSGMLHQPTTPGGQVGKMLGGIAGDPLSYMLPGAASAVGKVAPKTAAAGLGAVSGGLAAADTAPAGEKSSLENIPPDTRPPTGEWWVTKRRPKDQMPPFTPPVMSEQELAPYADPPWTPPKGWVGDREQRQPNEGPVAHARRVADIREQRAKREAKRTEAYEKKIADAQVEHAKGQEKLDKEWEKYDAELTKLDQEYKEANQNFRREHPTAALALPFIGAAVGGAGGYATRMKLQKINNDLAKQFAGAVERAEKVLTESGASKDALQIKSLMPGAAGAQASLESKIAPGGTGLARSVNVDSKASSAATIAGGAAGGIEGGLFPYEWDLTLPPDSPDKKETMDWTNWVERAAQGTVPGALGGKFIGGAPLLRNKVIPDIERGLGNIAALKATREANEKALKELAKKRKPAAKTTAEADPDKEARILAKRKAMLGDEMKEPPKKAKKSKEQQVIEDLPEAAIMKALGIK